MRLTYSGKTKDFTPDLEEKITTKLSRLSKHVEQRGEREAHIVHQVERHLHKIGIEVKFYDHNLIAEGSDADLEIAVCNAIEKLETQVLKLRNRWRDTHRDPKTVRSSKENWDQTFPNPASEPSTPTQKSLSPNGSGARKPRIFRVDYRENSKPMTLEEALIEIENNQDYFVYRDAAKNCLSVLVRRPDGNFDLIES
ncbi:MAG: ribosome-associated translation inhibitor RaiA [Acidobacteriaceae bacterium]|nr:ribosome-associated translation inhibitor RaiA [Acidobacteriaceae bacterium]